MTIHCWPVLLDKKPFLSWFEQYFRNVLVLRKGLLESRTAYLHWSDVIAVVSMFWNKTKIRDFKFLSSLDFVLKYTQENKDRKCVFSQKWSFRPRPNGCVNILLRFHVPSTRKRCIAFDENANFWKRNSLGVVWTGRSKLLNTQTLETIGHVISVGGYRKITYCCFLLVSLLWSLIVNWQIECLCS